MSEPLPRDVLFVVPYPRGCAASQRFRFEQYLSALDEAGVEYRFETFWSRRAFSVLYKAGHRWQKFFGFVEGVARRVAMLFRARRYDVVFLHREAMPLGPPVVEWLLSRLLGRKVVYDFDDAIWLPAVSRHNRIVGAFKYHGKVATICRWARRVSCGNAYLADYARRYNDDVVVNVTVVNSDGYHNRSKQHVDGVPTIGWTGSHGTAEFVLPLVPVLRRLRARHPFRFRFIADVPPPFELEGLEFVPWRKESEIEDLVAIDVGVMPLPDTEWAKGKCGFKILQYMALGIPPVASRVGVNGDIIEQGTDGLLCGSDAEWEESLRRLIIDTDLRAALGAAARRKVGERYSARANRDRFMKTLDL